MKKLKLKLGYYALRCYVNYYIISQMGIEKVKQTFGNIKKRS